MGNIPDNFQLARPWRRSVPKPLIDGCTQITGQTWWRSAPKWLTSPRCRSVLWTKWTLMGVSTLISWSDSNGGLHPIGWPKSDSGLHSAVHLSNLYVPILLLSKLYVFICGYTFCWWLPFLCLDIVVFKYCFWYSWWWWCTYSYIILPMSC
jgi:hypothetical protein